MANCESCLNLKYEGVNHHNAQPSYKCVKGHWKKSPIKEVNISIEHICEDFKN